ncbi:hypothetical protein ATK74_1400 [Propionicimonas paludicola]|uniref:Uncharacterized protein n=1 Tax=Propionicimonas paludicola TaxID=185243 RepID=A0A2A9CRX4_9ACTN|nr:hypothetical protein [Propionicimonas paludicola]PFG16845.1 hypothetical protein ATK74_1400 [Propionicimonas paludicola]
MAAPAVGFSGPTLITASFYPARVAYLIKAGSRAGLRRAVQEATTRWGGISEVILPVSRDGSVGGWWSQVAATANLDAAVTVDVPEDTARRAASQLRLPFVHLRDIDRTGPSSATCHPLVVNGAKDLSVISANGSLWETVLAGDVSPEHLDAMADAAWPVRREELPDQVARAALTGTTAIDRTAAQLACSSGGGAGRTPAMIWLTPGRTVTDLLWFWNLRALSSKTSATPMVLLPLKDVGYWLGFGKQVQGLLRRPAEFSPDVVVFSISRDSAAVHAAAHSLGLQPAASMDIKTGFRWPAEYRVPPFTYRLADNYDFRWWFLSGRTYGKQVQVEVQAGAGRGRLHLESPVSWRGSAGTLVALRGPALDRLPKRSAVAEAVIRNGEWRDGGLQVATTTMPSYDFQITLPSLEEATWIAIRESTRSAKLSDKGRLGAALADRSSQLLMPDIYEVALELATPRKHALVAELKTETNGRLSEDDLNDLAERWGGTARRAYRAIRGIRSVPPPRAARAAEALCDAGWAGRGFEVRCDACGLRSFVPLRQSTDRPHCPECNARQPYSLDASGPRIHYQLGSLADRAVDQGVMPHLIVAALLRRREEQTFVLPGLAVEALDGSLFEVDLVGTTGGLLFAGEVKSNGRAFTEEQVTADVAHSVTLGANLHLMASVSDIPDEAQHLAARLCKTAGIQMEVLDRRSLRPVS